MKKIKTSLKSVKTKITDFIINFFKNLTVNLKMSIRYIDNLIQSHCCFDEEDAKTDINALLFVTIDDFIPDNINYANMTSKQYENLYIISNGFKKNGLQIKRDNGYTLFNSYYFNMI